MTATLPRTGLRTTIGDTCASSPVGQALKHSEYDGAGRIPAIGDPIDMLVGNQYRDNVGYVIEERWDKKLRRAKREPVGTAFIVSWHLEGIVTHYAVTCLHVINPGKGGKKLPLFVRLNGEAGASIDISAPYDTWVRSANSDVAVSRIGLDTFVRFWAYPLEEMLRWGSIRPTVGDDIFVAGLFSQYPGQTSVEALIRSGTVAREDAATDVMINTFTKETRRIKAYLVQSLAWGGESGSPVFAYRPQQKLEGLEATALRAPRPSVKTIFSTELIGMLHGHFPIEYEGSAANSGIAIVIPVKQIYDTLMDPRLIADREKAAAKKRTAVPLPKPLSLN